MKVTCGIYANTGFNAINIPDSIETLGLMGADNVYVGIVDINSLYLPTVRIKKTFEEIGNADYVVLTTYDTKLYYAYTVSTIIMLAPDVAELHLLIDAYNSIGGLLNPQNQILQGFVERYNVNDDVYGKYALAESFTPTNPLNIVFSKLFGDDANNYKNIIELCCDVENGKSEVLKPSTSAPNDEVLLIPLTKKVTQSNVTYRVGSKSIKRKNPISQYFEVTDQIIEKIKILRSYGLDNSILSSYQVPTSFISINGNDIESVSTIYPASTIGINLQYATVRNLKVLYSDFCKIKLYSVASGNSAEFVPSDISNGGSFNIRIDADVRASGKPTAFFTYYKNQNVDSIYTNCVDGLTWANVPIVWTDKSGTNVDRLNFNTSQTLASNKINLSHEQKQVSNVANTAFDVVGDLFSGNVKGAIKSGIGGVSNATTTGIDYLYAKRERALEYNAESQIFNRNNYYVQPEVSYPRSEAVRDFIGNNFIVSQLQMSTADVTNFDNYLTQFGYNVGGVTFDTTMLNSRPHFNFIKFSSVSILSPRAMWLRKECESQMMNGVRIWHTKPSPEKMLAFGNG